MRRYLVFAGDIYYPAGGWADFIGSLDEEDEAKKFAKERSNRRGVWAHIVDITTGQTVWDTGNA